LVPVIDPEQFEHDRRLDRLVEAHSQQVEMHGVAGHRVARELLDDDRR
jgi:hypothetical protein